MISEPKKLYNEVRKCGGKTGGWLSNSVSLPSWHLHRGTTTSASLLSDHINALDWIGESALSCESVSFDGCGLLNCSLT